MRKGPNDARHIVWALGECFLISFIFFDDNICFNADMTYNIQTTRLERLWKAKMARKGPNNVSSIVWGLPLGPLSPSSLSPCSIEFLDKAVKYCDSL